MKSRTERLTLRKHLRLRQTWMYLNRYRNVSELNPNMMIVNVGITFGRMLVSLMHFHPPNSLVMILLEPDAAFLSV